MKVVGIKKLKNQLSQYVRLASRGETIFVTDRDEVVAELSPPRPGASRRVDDAVTARLIEEGWLTPAAERSDVPPASKPSMPTEELLRGLEKDRGDR